MTEIHSIAGAPLIAGTAPRMPIVWCALIAAALLSTALSWFAADRLARTVRTQADEKASSDPYAFSQLNAELIRVNSRDSGARYATLGGVTGLMFAAFGLALGRKPVTGVIGMVAGLAVGGAVGWGAVQVIYPWFYEMERNPPDAQIQKIFLGHWAMWGGAGLAAGLGYALALGRYKSLPKTILGGVLGVGVAGLLYELIIPMLFPTLPDASHALPEDFTARLIIWIAVPLSTAVGMGVALSIGTASSSPTANPASNPEPAPSSSA